jgi:hypothetical protein
VALNFQFLNHHLTTKAKFSCFTVVLKQQHTLDLLSSLSSSIRYFAISNVFLSSISISHFLFFSHHFCYIFPLLFLAFLVSSHISCTVFLFSGFSFYFLIYLHSPISPISPISHISPIFLLYLYLSIKLFSLLLNSAFNTLSEINVLMINDSLMFDFWLLLV